MSLTKTIDPIAKDTDPLNQMGNVFPLFGTRKNMGNCVSIPFSSDLAPKFTDPVPSTSDLEPDRSIYRHFIFMRRISQSFRLFSKK